MKKAVTIGLAALALGLPLTYVVAGSRTFGPAPVPPADAMPVHELFTRLRMLALEPQGEPVRRGPYVVLLAADARGRSVRVVADAELGDIISIVPTRTAQWRPYGGPRIIHIPEASDDMPDARLEERDAPLDVPADIEEEAREPGPPPATGRSRPHRREADTSPPQRTVARRPAAIVPAAPAAPAAVSEPAPLDRRNTLAGPAADAAARDPLTPVYPTPRFAPPDAPETPAPQLPQAPDAAPAPAGDATPAQSQ